MNKYFITGIGTEVGKTVVSAIVTEALAADYWKPIQAGDLEFSDTDKVKALVSCSEPVFHPNSFALKTPMSPHAAADLDNIEIALEKVVEPQTHRDLVIEGAGGLMVPLNNTHTMIDLIKPDYQVILVSRNYLGSINHTLLSVEALRHRNLHCIGIIFNGEPTPTTEKIITKMTGLPTLLHLKKEASLDKETIRRYARELKGVLKGKSNGSVRGKT